MTYTEAKACLKEVDKDTLRELIEQFGEDIVRQYYEEGYDLNSMQEAYQGQYDNDEDFAQQMAEDLGLIHENAGWPSYCIDWEQASSELMMDYFEIDGHYFRQR
jgi:antirestriction protein